MNELTTEILDNIKPFSGTPGEITNQVIGSGNALQQTKTAYTTAVAVQQPRSITKITNNVLEEARLAGSSFYYGWPVKDKRTGRKVTIEGPSIDLAMCLARNYGNCVIDVDGTETASHFMIKGTFIDLETGFTVPRLFRQRKTQSVGSGYGADRSEDMVFQIAQSKAQRNAIIKAMPKWLIDKAIETAKAAESCQIENLAESRAKAVEYFSANYGINQERIEAVIGRPADQWVKMDLVELKGTITAIKEGRIKADEAFPKIGPEQPRAHVAEPPVDTQEQPSIEPVDASPESTTEQQPAPKPEQPVSEQTKLDPTKFESWINLRPGTPSKGTGLWGYVNNNLEAFKAAWPHMPTDDRKRLKSKWHGFYGEKTPLPFDTEQDAPQAKAVDSSVLAEMIRLFNIHRETPAWHYAQGQTIGDENAAFPPKKEDAQKWIDAFTEFVDNLGAE